MRIGFASRLTLVIIAVAVIGACSFPKHSNTLVFGTNTKIALDVGTAPDGRPNVTLGYKRQEAVWMPLLVNKDDQCADNATGGCKYVAKDGTSKEDAYSVLASFGAEFAGDANAKGQEAEASGGLAQYFATGLAARELARFGGAALVSTSQNAMTPGVLRIAEEGLVRNERIITQIANCVKNGDQVNGAKLTQLIQGTPYQDDPLLKDQDGVSIETFKNNLRRIGNSVQELAANIPTVCNEG